MVLDRELTYKMPFERLTRLSRSAGRKAFAATWYATWLLLAAYFALLGLLMLFDDEIARLQLEAGIPWWLWLVLLMSLTFVGLFLVRRRGRQAVQSRADFESTVTLREEANGLRFTTPEIEYLIKWNGISQMMMEHDGVVVSHGALFFLIPDDAFASQSGRDNFVRDVFSKLSEEARERSKRFVKFIVDPAQNAPGA